MAKQAVSPIERHVEKGVLGVTALVLLSAVAMFLVRSPNTLEMDGQEVGPGEIDDRVRAKAQTVRASINRFKPEVEMPENPLGELRAGEDLLGALRWGSAVGASCVRSISATDGVFTRSEAEQFMQQHPLQVDPL